MGWTAPPTFTYAQAMTTTIMNTYLRDNLLWLKTRPWTSLAVGFGGSSSSFEPVTTTTSLTTVGGDVVMFFSGRVSHGFAANVACAVDFGIDGARVGDATNGLQLFTTHGTTGLYHLATPLYITSSATGTTPTAGSHIYGMYIKAATAVSLSIVGTMYIAELF